MPVPLNKSVYFLLFFVLWAVAPVRVAAQQGSISARIVVTTNFQKNIFSPGLLSESYGHSPGFYSVYLSRALAYIDAYRDHLGPENVFLVNCGENLDYFYRFYPDDIKGRVRDFMGYDSSRCFSADGTSVSFVPMDSLPQENNGRVEASGAGGENGFTVGLYGQKTTDPLLIARTAKTDLAVAAYGREPDVCRIVNFRGDTVTVVNTGTTGRYLAVIDVVDGRLVPKVVDISSFGPHGGYLERFRPLSDSVRMYFLRPLTQFPRNFNPEDSAFGPSALASLFHRFHLETTGAELSFFSLPKLRSWIFAGVFTRKDLFLLFPFENELCVAEMTGREVKDHLEFAYDRRLRTMRSETDNLLKFTEDGENRPRTVYPVHQWDGAAGIEYTVDVTRNYGSKVEIVGMSDGTHFDPDKRYRVAMNSHRAGGGGGHLSKGAGIGEDEIPVRIVYRSKEDYRLLLAEWLGRQKIIQPEVIEKWKILPEEWTAQAKEREMFRLRSISD